MRIPALLLVALSALGLFCTTPGLAAEALHWSFRPLRSTSVPLPPTDRRLSSAKTPIDAFLQDTLEQHALHMNDQADRATQLRRLSLVMLGLPPSPAELDDFLQDPRPTEMLWPRLLDRVLADPRLGERWAPHWLDVIRWAETVGFETNAPRPNAWHYRDWVIDAFNADKPYDRFLLEQLAGDTCAEDAALGFLVAGPANLPGQIGRDELAMRTARQDELDEVIRTVSQAFMGLTVGCARCHDHKFDPISAEDYYRFQAIFSGLRYGDRRLRGPENDAWSAQVPTLERQRTALHAEREGWRQKHGLRPTLTAVQEERFTPLSTGSIRMRIEATQNGQAASLYEVEVWSAQENLTEPTNVALASRGSVATASSFALENQTRHPDCLNDGSVDQRQAFPWRAGQGGPAWIRVDFPRAHRIDRITWHQGFSAPADYRIEALSPDGSRWIEVAHARDRLPAIADTRPAASVKLAGLATEAVADIVSLNGKLRQLDQRLARLKAGPQVYGASFTPTPEPTWHLRRGDPMQRLKPVNANVPPALGDLGLSEDAPETAQRLALARHLTSPDHPLTARVIVNRLWKHHFGRGLVSTPSDFGAMGRPPSHPELLDWLARDLIQHEWSLKRTFRLLLSTHAFQQSSRPRSEALQVDAEARWLWRFPPRRLEAEVIRDAMLAVSGKLNPRRGGVGFDFFVQQGGLSDYQAHETFSEDGWRRMVYARKIRMQAVDIFGNFDCPDAGQMTPHRTQSITPLQSLGLMNSPFANRQASFLAQRLANASGGAKNTSPIRHAIKAAFSREATPEEVALLTDLARTHGLEQVARVLFNSSEFLYLP